jgi:hypothetical protein
MPAIIIRKAVGLTLGGPHANAIRNAALAAEKEAISARSLVLLGKSEITLIPPAMRYV